MSTVFAWVWTRTCPRCGEVLRRPNPWVKVWCVCGWLWE
jgi:hypothetical protein